MVQRDQKGEGKKKKRERVKESDVENPPVVENLTLVGNLLVVENFQWTWIMEKATWGDFLPVSLQRQTLISLWNKPFASHQIAFTSIHVESQNFSFISLLVTSKIISNISCLSARDGDRGLSSFCFWPMDLSLGWLKCSNQNLSEYFPFFSGLNHTPKYPKGFQGKSGCLFKSQAAVALSLQGNIWVRSFQSCTSSLYIRVGLQTSVVFNDHFPAPQRGACSGKQAPALSDWVRTWVEFRVGEGGARVRCHSHCIWFHTLIWGFVCALSLGCYLGLVFHGGGSGDTRPHPELVSALPSAWWAAWAMIGLVKWTSLSRP